MSFYLALANTGVALQAFKERGIAYLMPGSIDDVQAVASPYNTSSYFVSFLRSIQKFAKARLENIHTHVTQDFYNMFKPVKCATTFEVPTAVFHFDDLSEDQKSELQSYGLREDIASRNTFIGSPHDGHLSNIFKLGPVDRRIVPGHVSAEGYLAYIYALKGFQLYASLSQLVLRGCPTFAYSVSGADKVHNEMDESTHTMDVVALGETAIGRTFGKALAIGVGVIYSDPVAQIATISLSTLDKGFIDMSDLSKLPQCAGIFFPYFAGMLNPDKSVMIHVFSTLFFHGLDNSFEGATSLWSRIRPGLKNFAFTAAGRSLSHLYFGINLSSQTGSVIHCILSSGKYVGFTLQLADLKVAMYGNVQSAVPYTDLIKEIGSLNAHEEALGEIAGLINGIIVDGRQKYHVSVDMINTSRKLVDVLMSVDDADRTPEWESHIRNFQSDIVFGDRYAALTQENIIVFLSFVQTGDKSILRSFNAYIDNGYLLSTDRVRIGLGIFGHLAPTFGYASKNSISFIIPGPNAEDHNLKEVNGKRSLQYLPFITEPIRTAAMHWDNLFKTGKISLPAPRKGKQEFTPSAGVVVKIGQAVPFMAAYSRIKERVEVVKAAIPDRAGKRKRDEDKEGPKKKPKATAASLSSSI